MKPTKMGGKRFPPMKTVRPYRVRATYIVETETVIEARTPEEAESIYESEYAHGGQDLETVRSLDEVEATPVDIVDGELIEDREVYS